MTISGAPTISGVSLYGGAGTNSCDAFTGNVLNIRTSGALTVDGLQNFQYLNFFLPAAIQPGDTMLTVNTQYANLTGAVGNIQGNRSSIINVGVDGAEILIALDINAEIVQQGRAVQAGRGVFETSVADEVA